MVDAGIKAEFPHHIVAFLSSSGNAHDVAAKAFGELANDGAHRAACRVHHHGLARLGLTDVDEARPSGDPWHAQNAEVGACGYSGRVDAFDKPCIHGGVGLPAAVGED